MCVIQSGDIVKQYKYLESVEYYILIKYCGLGQSENPGRFMALVGLVDLVGLMTLVGLVVLTDLVAPVGLVVLVIRSWVSR